MNNTYNQNTNFHQEEDAPSSTKQPTRAQKLAIIVGSLPIALATTVGTAMAFPAFAGTAALAVILTTTTMLSYYGATRPSAWAVISNNKGEDVTPRENNKLSFSRDLWPAMKAVGAGIAFGWYAKLMLPLIFPGVQLPRLAVALGMTVAASNMKGHEDGLMKGTWNALSYPFKKAADFVMKTIFKNTIKLQKTQNPNESLKYAINEQRNSNILIGIGGLFMAFGSGLFSPVAPYTLTTFYVCRSLQVASAVTTLVALKRANDCHNKANKYADMHDLANEAYPLTAANAPLSNWTESYNHVKEGKTKALN